jgi:hypothetical protein
MAYLNVAMWTGALGTRSAGLEDVKVARTAVPDQVTEGRGLITLVKVNKIPHKTEWSVWGKKQVVKEETEKLTGSRALGNTWV